MTWRKTQERSPKFYDIDLENVDFNRVKQYLKKWQGETVNAKWMREHLIKKFGYESNNPAACEDNPWPAFFDVIEDCMVQSSYLCSCWSLADLTKLYKIL